MTLIYKGNYINRSRQQLLDSLSQRLKPTRFEHVLRVEATALAIAKPLEVEPEKISVAALMHDYAKDMDQEEMYQLAYAYWPHETLEQAGTAVWHGFAAAYICREEFGCQDESILQAISSHTIGGYNMDSLAKIIYMADYIEPGRTFNGVEHARQLTETDLDAACDYKMTETLHHLVDQNQYIFPETVWIYNSRIKELNN